MDKSCCQTMRRGPPCGIADGWHLLDERQRNRQTGRILVDPAVGYDPNEADRNEHAQRERFNAVDESLQPLCWI